MKKMEEIFKNIGRIFNDITDISTKACAMLVGLITSVAGYFVPIKDMVHLLIFFFILDVAFGFWAARKLRGERFSVKIIWNHTIPRMTVSIVLMIGAFMWDMTYNVDMVSTYKIVGWFISGVLLYSIAENGYKVTKWSVFPKIGNMFKNRLNDESAFKNQNEKKDDGKN